MRDISYYEQYEKYKAIKSNFTLKNIRVEKKYTTLSDGTKVLSDIDVYYTPELTLDKINLDFIVNPN